MKKVDFSDGKITQDILRTAFPMLVAQVLNLLYSIVDRIYIGRIPGSGSAALGAVGLCFPVIMIVAAFTNMFGLGGAPLFAMALGKGDRERASEIMNTSFRILLLIAVVITAIGELFGGPVLRLFGAGAEELPVSLSYLRIYIAGTLPLMISTGMNAFINAQGYALVGMISVIVGAGTNIILDPVLIFGAGLGVQGAALATLISQLLSFVFVMRFLFGPRNEYPVRFAWKFPHAAAIAGLGTAPFIMQFTNSLVQIACNQMLMRFGGVLFVSCMTIIASVRSILDVPVLAISEGTSPIISYNYGARKAPHVRKAVKVMMCMAVPYTLLTWILVLARPLWFIRIFSTDPALQDAAVRGLHLYFAAFIFQAFQYCGQTVFKALGKKKQAVFFSLLRKVVLVVPLTLVLPFIGGLGTDGVFLAEPVSNVVGGTLCFITMLRQVLPELRQMESGNPGSAPPA